MSGTGRHVLRLSGYAPALPTPFDDAGELDLPALERLCHRQVESGATALKYLSAALRAHMPHDTGGSQTERPPRSA
jgi:hypothetical protein